MTAIVKKIEEKKGFQIPTVEEIRVHMKEKKEWPEKFLDYYSEKFWAFYQSNGWKVSGKTAMKDWRAAFTSQWQRPKFKEDIEFLNECMKEIPKSKSLHTVVSQNNKIQWLNDMLVIYKTNFELVNDQEFVRAYDYLKENKMIRLTKEEVFYIKAAYGNNVEKGKAACVKTMFTNMINHGKTF
jgi:hypothetical protein